MRKAIILHGVCDDHEFFDAETSPSNSHFYPWLQKKFLCSEILCQTPEMPTPYNPIYRQWVETFEQFTLDEETIIIGHSGGAGFFLKWLHQNNHRHFKKVVFIAPYLDPFKKYGNFLELELSTNVGKQLDEIHLLHSKDDPVIGVNETTEEILKTYPKIKFHEYEDRRHFLFDDIGLTFPELWDIAKPKENNQ